MTNKYSYNKDEKDLNHPMFSYYAQMVKYDFNSVALRIFAANLKRNNLEKIQALFAELTDTQKFGLITLQINYKEFNSNYKLLDVPVGKSIDLAKQLKCIGIFNYLTETLNTIQLESPEQDAPAYELSGYSFT